jgi:hypothetical protein
MYQLLIVWGDGKGVGIAPEQIEVREPQIKYTPFHKQKRIDSL